MRRPYAPSSHRVEIRKIEPTYFLHIHSAPPRNPDRIPGRLIHMETSLPVRLETTRDAEVSAAAKEDVFHRLVVSQRDRAFRLAWRLVDGDRAAAEDVVQDAFVKAYRGLDGFRGEAKLETWFYRILVRQAHTYHRWRAVRTRWPSGREGTHTNAEPVSDAENGDLGLRRRIARALDTLSRKQREAFVLIHLEGFSVKECAETMGSPDGTVKSHLHRALVKLRAELADLQD